MPMPLNEFFDKWKKENKMPTDFGNKDVPSEMPQPKVVNQRSSALLQFKNYGQVYVSGGNLWEVLRWLTTDLPIDHVGVRLEGIDVWLIYALP